MRLPDASRFLSRSTGIDKVAVVRDAMRRSPDVAFAGDGRPDLEPALLVPPERRFARGWLANALRQQGQSFHPFTSWAEIADTLLGRNHANCRSELPPSLKLRRTGARDPSSVRSAVALAKVECPAKEDTDGKIAGKPRRRGAGKQAPTPGAIRRACP